MTERQGTLEAGGFWNRWRWLLPALADTVVFGVIIALIPNVDRRLIASYWLAFLAGVAAWLLPSLAVAGARAVAFALIGFYQGYVAYGAPGSALGVVLRALGPALALVGTLLTGRDSKGTWPIWLWACADLAVSAIANRPYPHFLIPALAPAILALATIPGVRLRRISWRLAPLAAAFVITTPLALVAGTDFNALQAYAAWPAAQIGKHRAEWSAQLDIRSPADEATASWLHEQGLKGSTAVIWSSDPWLYLLADLPLALPTAPIYNNVVLLGSADAVVARVNEIQPTLIVTSEEALTQWPEIEPVLARDYQLAFSSYPNAVYLRLPGH